MYMGRMGALFGKMGRVALLGSAAAQALAVNGGYGLTVFSIDDSMVINDASTPANNYVGLPGSKLTTTRASSATYWDSSGVLQSAGNGVLRRDFDPRLSSTVERCGYLIEEARTNLVLQSQAAGTSWTASNISISSNVIEAPDGTTTADKIVENSSTAAHNISQNAGTVGGPAETFSAFLKAGERSWGVLQLGNQVAYFNLATGTIGTVNGGLTAAIVACPNGWYRCSVTGVRAAFLLNTVYVSTGDGVTSYAGDGASGIYAWGMQLEVGSFASSYIPTTTATVTRAADLVTLAGTLFPLNQTEGTLYAKFATMGGANPQRTLSLNDGTNNEVIDGFRNTNGTLSFSIVDGGSAQLGPTGLNSTTTIAVLTQGKQAGAYKLNDSAAAQLGETVQTDIVCTMPTTTTLVLGNRGGGGRELNGWLFEAAYFPSRKTNSQLQALASGYASDALLLASTETQYLTFSATDQSMSILDTTTSANNYTGELSTKLGSVRTSAAYTTLSSGLLGWGPENIIVRSAEFDDANWTKDTGISITANQATAPDGTLTGDLYTNDGSATGNMRLYQNVNGIGPLTTFTISVYAKQGTGRYLFFSCGGTRASAGTGAGADKVCIFDLQAGVITASSVYTTAMTDVGNGWYRCSITLYSDADAGAEAAVPYFKITTSPTSLVLPVSSSTIYLWGAQLERAASASTYKPTTSAAYYGLRLDYDSRLTGGPGYLVEEQRTNLCLQSQVLGTTWATSRASISADATAAPDGTTTADKIVEDATAANTHLISQNITFTAVVHTYSVYLKQAERTWARLVLHDGTTFFTCYFNLSTGAVGTASNCTGSIQSAANGFYRCVITTSTATAAAAGTIQIIIAEADSDQTIDGTGTSGIYAWGAQLEAGAFATSYIPTTTASVTRAADAPDLATSSFPVSLVNWSMYGRFTVMTTATPCGIASINDGTTNNRMDIRSSTSYGQVITSGGVLQTNGSAGSVSVLTKSKIAARATLNDERFAYTGGTLGAQDAAITMPVSATLLRLGRLDAGTNHLNGWLHEFAGAPVAWSDATLQAKAA